MFTKKFESDFHGQALNLSPDDLGEHSSGWTIVGDVHGEWVDDFEAMHPVYGRVYGNFEDEVFADTEEAFNHFYANHPPYEWDYWDI